MCSRRVGLLVVFLLSSCAISAPVVEECADESLDDYDELDEEDRIRDAKAEDVEWPAPDRDDFMKVSSQNFLTRCIS